ncbi:hypothetical protein GA0116948_108166 [Chitinophaga costaii]|uniref:Uncharacterized protein n=1 Tax=Chitinophaga costaii TaxID=1335309 RepID=A0A1C4EJE3_9BACT|nr:hypothetical protein [Chitinophaga costaii]PUZ23777.1 hypothetical protein DCM91_13335 [Chitinophaga costaii]SCC43756.1 hypothetical protein GA0116948_108166 [Chitinophaga costaii]
MKSGIARRLAEYILNNYIGNFLGFVVGLLSTKLVSAYFTTRSIHNLWGLTTHKSIVTKHTYTTLEWSISILIGFIMFELVSKWLKKTVNDLLPKYRLTRWMSQPEEENRAAR